MRYQKSLKDGMQIKNYVDINNTSEVLVIKKYVTYNTQEINNYKIQFAELKEDAVVENCSFEDNRWYISDDYHTYSIIFDEIKSEVNLVLKCYIVLKLHDRHLSPSSVYSSLFQIKKSLIRSNYFNIDNLVEYRESIKSWNDTEKQGLYYVREFIVFYNQTNTKGYLDVIQKVEIPPSNVRPLPSYKSILKFHYFITEFMKNANASRREKYYPLYLWWMITKIIPMRPIEFITLSRNCVVPKNNMFYIKIKRAKQRNGYIKFKKINPLPEIQVTKEIYDMVTEYTQMVDPMKKNKKLLSYESYRKCLIRDTVNHDGREYVKPDELRKILQSFYIDEVSKKYTVVDKGNGFVDVADNEIEHICLGDTRHIAFCEMLLQGLNPLTIAQIGGHETLREQMSYQSHLESYIDAKTFMLARLFCKNIYKNSVDVNIYKKIKDDVIERNRLGDKYYGLRKVPGGRCKSENFPNECIPDDCFYHFDCFISDETLSQEMIDRLLNKVNLELQEKLGCIKQLVKSVTILPDLEEYDIQEQEMLKTNFNALNTLINKKSIVMAYKMERGDKNGTS